MHHQGYIDRPRATVAIVVNKIVEAIKYKLNQVFGQKLRVKYKRVRKVLPQIYNKQLFCRISLI